MTTQIPLGAKVRDSLTGFSGMATTRATWLYGCVRIRIEPGGLKPDGMPAEAEWFDEQRVEVAYPQAVAQPWIPPAPSGGPEDDPQSARSGEERP